MFDPSSFANPTPPDHTDTSRDVLPRGEGIDNQIKLLGIPSDISCAYLKGHLLGRALDWYQIFGSALVQNTATDFAQLKAALSNAFPAIQNKKELETRFYASQQRQNQEPTDFVYDLLKLNKKLELGMSEKALVDHIFVRLVPQVLDYVEVRNPQTAIQLLEVIAKFEERYSRARQHWVREIVITWKDEVGMSVGCLMLVIIEEIGEILKWCVDRIMVEMIIGVTIRTAVKEISGSRAGMFQNDDRRFNDRGYQFRNRGQNDDFSRGDGRDFYKRVMGHWSGVVIYIGGVPKILFYKQVKKSITQVITAQGAKCRNMEVVELNIRIREFEKPWLFHVLADLEYPCILGIDFIGGSKIILDFDRKSLAIQDSQVKDIKKEKPKGRDGSAHHKRLQSETKKGEKRGVPTDHREEDNKDDQFDPETAEEGTIAPTSKSEQDQATRMPDEVVIDNGKTRKGEERVQRNPCHWRSW
ncbi:uncharacterized protein TNCV_4432921 [Trichonephila clavipes]|nr:uncharacterized protein TNCV_4432921 [Trichonephila clavipes]